MTGEEIREAIKNKYPDFNVGFSNRRVLIVVKSKNNKLWQAIDFSKNSDGTDWREISVAKQDEYLKDIEAVLQSVSNAYETSM